MCQCAYTTKLHQSVQGYIDLYSDIQVDVAQWYKHTDTMHSERYQRDCANQPSDVEGE